MTLRKMLSFAVSLMALSLMLFLPVASRANTYNAAAAGGHIAVTGTAVVTGFNVNIYQLFNSTTNLTTKGGSIGVINSTLWANAGQDHAEYSWRYTANNTLYAHVEITSKTFTFYDYALRTAYQARLVVTLSKLGAMGQGGYKVIRVDNNTIVNQTTTTGVSLKGSGTYAEIPFTLAPCRVIM